jgi:UDP-N-acetylglucosamine 2-epimerase (non-hydrolysing)
VTLRDNTERPETVDVGANVLAGVSATEIKGTKQMLSRLDYWTNPFGDGQASNFIMN